MIVVDLEVVPVDVDHFLGPDHVPKVNHHVVAPPVQWKSHRSAEAVARDAVSVEVVAVAATVGIEQHDKITNGYKR